MCGTMIAHLLKMLDNVICILWGHGWQHATFVEGATENIPVCLLFLLLIEYLRLMQVTIMLYEC